MSTFEVIAAVLLVVSALGVVVLQNAVHAALALITNFLVLSGVYVALDARFLAAVQVIVYAGAIMVLFLFVIMLLSASKAEVGRNPLPRMGWFAGVIGVALAAGLVAVLLQYTPAMSAIQAAKALQGGLPQGVGQALYGPWVYAVELIGLLLLAATVAAVVMVQPHISRPSKKPQMLERERESGVVR